MSDVASVIDFETLLAPIDGDNPAGESLRYDGTYDQIKEARREDEVLSQGDWTRDLKVADWPKVIKLATDAIQQIVPLLQEKQRLDYKPDVILVISPTGKVVARWRFANLSGEQLAFPLLKRVVENRTRDDDVWKFREQNERMMTAVAAPILDGAKVVGVLALLYEHSNQMALDDRRTFKTEVAYFDASG